MISLIPGETWKIHQIMLIKTILTRMLTRVSIRDKSSNNSNFQSNNNFATSSDIFNRDNKKELAQSRHICFNENFITSWSALCGRSQMSTPQNVTNETEYNHRASPSPITQVHEKPTNKPYISKNTDPSPNLEIIKNGYPSRNLHDSVNKRAPLKH